jgi:predicted alpha/beta-hydrolase family hydrolase
MKVGKFESKSHTFIAHPDKGEVSALMLRPPKATHLLVLGHGAGAGMEHPNMESIAQALAGQGIATFRYQFPFMERGGGRDSQKVSLATVHNAIQAAKEVAPELLLMAGGHSFGGRMTSLAAAEADFPTVEGLVFFSFPLHAPGRAGTDRAAHLPQIPYPMLFLSGDRDTFAKPELLGPLIEGLGATARLHWLETGNHGYKTLKRSRTNPLDIFEEMAMEVKKFTSKP